MLFDFDPLVWIGPVAKQKSTDRTRHFGSLKQDRPVVLLVEVAMQVHFRAAWVN